MLWEWGARTGRESECTHQKSGMRVHIEQSKILESIVVVVLESTLNLTTWSKKGLLESEERGQFMCGSAPFTAGFITYDASILPSSSWVCLWSQRELSRVIKQQRTSKMNKKKNLFVQNKTINWHAHPLNDWMESQSMNIYWWWCHPSLAFAVSCRNT